MHKPPRLGLQCHIQLAQGPGRKESLWVSRERKSAWLNGLRSRRAGARPRGWWMNELPPPLRSSSEQDSFPSPPPGFLGQEAEGDKRALSAEGQQRTEQRSPPALLPWQKARAAPRERKYLRSTFPSAEGKAHDGDLMFNKVCSNRKMNRDPLENVVLIFLEQNK